MSETRAKRQTVEIEAASVEEARGAVAGQVPAGFVVLGEKIIQSNEPVTLRREGEDSDAAYAKAIADVPEGAEVVERKEIRPAERSVVTIDAFTEEEARGRVPGDVLVEDVKLTSAGKRGVLGMGKKPSHYEIGVLRPGQVEISYRLPLKVAFRVGEPNEYAEALALTEALVGVWPSELPMETFDDYDFDAFFEWVEQFGSKPHAGTLGMGSKPTYRMVDGGIGREGNGVDDCMVASTARRLAGRGTVSPFDDRASRYTFELIQAYGDWKLAKFVFLLPFIDQFGGKEGKNVVIAEEAMIQVYKCVENTLFDVCDDLGQGQTFDDEMVRRKLLSYVRRFAHASAAA